MGHSKMNCVRDWGEGDVAGYGPTMWMFDAFNHVESKKRQSTERNFSEQSFIIYCEQCWPI